jgi:hypothetical protein
MRKPGTLILSALFAVFAAVLLGLSTPALALEDAWNQELVTQAAEKFEKEVSALYDKARIENQEYQMSPVGIQSYLLVDDMKTLRRHSRALLRNLKNGASRDETVQLFERMQIIIRTLRTRLPSTPLLSGAQPEMDTARGTLNELRAFYGIEPLPPPVAAQQRK